MRLCEHPDSRDIIQAVADQIDRTPQFVEKDYYVTEALRISVTTLNQHSLYFQRRHQPLNDVIGRLQELAPQI